MDIFSCKKRLTPSFFNERLKRLTETCIPILEESIVASTSSLSSHSTAVFLVSRHIENYYETLNKAADTETIPYLIFSSWRNSLETPFLFLGDIHPSIFTSLIRSLIHQGNLDSNINPSELGFSDLEHPWKDTFLWKNPSDEMMKTVKEMEDEIETLLPSLQARILKAHTRFLTRVSDEWIKSRCVQAGANETTVSAIVAAVAVDEAAQDDMTKILGIFVDANNLRRNVIRKLVKSMTNLQAHQYLQGLCRFLVGISQN